MDVRFARLQESGSRRGYFSRVRISFTARVSPDLVQDYPFEVSLNLCDAALLFSPRT
jgi:hypothetical protein